MFVATVHVAILQAVASVYSSSVVELQVVLV